MKIDGYEEKDGVFPPRENWAEDGRVSDRADKLVGQKPLGIMTEKEKINLILELQRENKMLRDGFFKAKALLDAFSAAAELDMPNATDEARSKTKG